MNLGEKIFIYCERGQDPSFWAEPLNAVTNAAFILAAIAATRDYATAPREQRMLGRVDYDVSVGHLRRGRVHTTNGPHIRGNE